MNSQDAPATGRFAAADQIGQCRVWMDANGIDVLVTGGQNSAICAEVISAGAAVRHFDSALLAQYLHLILKPQQVLGVCDMDPALSSLLLARAEAIGASYVRVESHSLAVRLSS